MYPRVLIRRNPPFNHFDLTSLESNFPCTLVHNYHFYRQSGQNNKGKGPHIPWACSAPQPSHPRNIAPTRPQLYLYPAKVSPTPRRAIMCYCAPLEERFPCVARNIFSMHSLCYSFVIVMTGEGLGEIQEEKEHWWDQEEDGGGGQKWLRRRRRSIMTTKMMKRYGTVRTMRQFGEDGIRRRWGRWRQRQIRRRRDLEVTPPPPLCLFVAA